MRTAVKVRFLAGAVAVAILASPAAALTPDEVAMVLGTLAVAGRHCGLKTNNFPLNVAVAKLGQDLVGFQPDEFYFPLVRIKYAKAIEYIDLVGLPRAGSRDRWVSRGMDRTAGQRPSI